MKKVSIICAAALVLVFGSIIYSQFSLYLNYRAEEKKLIEELAKEKETFQQLQREQEQYMSDAYVEKIAAEKLGLVHHDEIVFIDDSAK